MDTHSISIQPPSSARFFRKVTGRTWDLSVQSPFVGTSYSIDWSLPKSKKNSFASELERDVGAFRRALLRYGKMRRDRPSRVSTHSSDIAGLLRVLYDSLRGADDHFTVSLMAYSESDRHLVVVDGIRNGRDLDSDSWKFCLPFGLGLGGACFKSGNRVFVRDLTGEKGRLGLKDKPDSDHGFYLHITGRSQPKFLLQVPLDHPKFNEERCPAGYERGRQSPGVLSIASVKGETWVASLREPEQFRDLKRACQTFCNAVYRVLMIL